ncbi:hypothetical protein pdul_cds_28 [Pandoravirus dulcis]|uniref:Uncharacterized protein n=1 Tax=Pandoravirus dulcis TaxID=1349409 RepID=S4VV96_9VIRU|nr:hypothetical protein pdul_cds_28 [Pandoravirus dulcis]AGO81904.1 hypothetical protein pdul_cds_28 [Pandoravirus dulcis]
MSTIANPSTEADLVDPKASDLLSPSPPALHTPGAEPQGDSRKRKRRIADDDDDVDADDADDDNSTLNKGADAKPERTSAAQDADTTQATRAIPATTAAGADDELAALRRELQQMAKAKADAEARLAAETKARLAAETRRAGRGRADAAEDARVIEPLPDEPWAMSAERRGALVDEAGRVLAAAEEHWRRLDAAQREAMEAAGPTRADRARAKTAGITQASMWVRAWGFIHYHMACLYKETIAGGRAARVGRGVPTDPDELAEAEARANASLVVERIRMARFFHDTARRFHEQFAPPVDARGCPIRPQMASMPSRHVRTVALSHPALAAAAVGPEVAEIAALPDNARRKASARAAAKGSPSASSSASSSTVTSPRPAAKRARTAKAPPAKPRRMSARDFIDDEVEDDDDGEEDESPQEEEDEDEEEEGEDLGEEEENDDDGEQEEDAQEDDRSSRKRKMALLAAKAQAAKSRRR